MTPSSFLRLFPALLLLTACASPSIAQAEGEESAGPGSLVQELRALRAQVAQLEAALAERHQGSSKAPSPPVSAKAGSASAGTVPKAMAGMEGGSTQKKKMGMGGMSPGMGSKKGESMAMKAKSASAKGSEGGMGMAGMGMAGMGAKMMGKGRMRMMGMVRDQTLETSSLPGFPGTSHLYHIGSTGFFLDHDAHVRPTPEQREKLGRIREEALLKNASHERTIEELEQALWTLTGAAEPDLKKIEAKLREIEKHRVDMRLDFIRAVGRAAVVLTEEQRGVLSGLEAGQRPKTTSSAKE